MIEPGVASVVRAAMVRVRGIGLVIFTDFFGSQCIPFWTMLKHDDNIHYKELKIDTIVRGMSPTPVVYQPNYLTQII